MAKTKKAAAIQVEKEALRNKVRQLNEEIRLQATKVPMRVRQGSHNQAVAWKELAERMMNIHGVGATKITTNDLEALVRKRKAQLQHLK